MGVCWRWLSYIFSLFIRLKLSCSVLCRLWLQFLSVTNTHHVQHQHDAYFSMEFSTPEGDILTSPAIACWNWRLISAFHFWEGTQVSATVCIWFLAAGHLCLWRITSFSSERWKSHLKSLPPHNLWGRGGVWRFFLVANTLTLWCLGRLQGWTPRYLPAFSTL